MQLLLMNWFLNWTTWKTKAAKIQTINCLEVAVNLIMKEVKKGPVFLVAMKALPWNFLNLKLFRLSLFWITIITIKNNNHNNNYFHYSILNNPLRKIWCFSNSHQLTLILAKILQILILIFNNHNNNKWILI